MNTDTHALCPLSENTGDQVVHAERAGDPAVYCCTAFGGGVARKAMPVNRHKHQESGLSRLAVFLPERYFFRKGRLSGVASLFHGSTSDRFCEGVITEDPHVTPGKWFQINNRGITVTFSCRMDRIVGKPLFPGCRNVGFLMGRRDDGCVADSL